MHCGYCRILCFGILPILNFCTLACAVDLNLMAMHPVPVLDVLSLNSNSTFLFPKPQKPDHFDNLVTWCHHEVDICGFEENVFTANR